MGRPYTGADTTTRAPRLELSKLMRSGYFTKDAEVRGGWQWDNGDIAEIYSKRSGNSAFMDVITHYTDYNGEEQKAEQRIHMHFIPSNLGRGHVLYFICPHTGAPCRILYRAYHSSTWRSRQAFHRALYYPQQRHSGWTRHNQREYNLEAKLERLYSMKDTGTHMGRPTRRAIRIAKLERKLEHLARLGWSPMLMPAILRRAMEQGLDLGLDRDG